MIRTAIALAVFALVPLEGLDSPYAQWGWRIPFVIGAALAGVLACYYIFQVSESEIWKVETKAGRDKQPVSELVNVPGVDFVGTIPDEIQFVSVFSAAIMAASKQPEESKKLIAFLASDRARAHP